MAKFSFKRSSHPRTDAPTVILGMGRFGQALGEELVKLGGEVLAVDSDPHRVQELADTFEHIVCADTTQTTALKQLGVQEAGQVVIAIGSDLAGSILTASAVIDLEVKDVWAKADSTPHAKILRQIGCHHVIRPEADTGRRVAHLLSGGLEDYIEFDGGVAVAKMIVTRKLSCRWPDNLPEGLSVVAVKKHNGFVPLTAEDPLPVGTIAIVAGSSEELERLTD